MDNIKQCVKNVLDYIIDNSKCSNQSIDEQGYISIDSFVIPSVSIKTLIENLSTNYNIVDIKTAISILRKANIIELIGRQDGTCNSVSITETGYKFLVNNIF